MQIAGLETTIIQLQNSTYSVQQALIPAVQAGGRAYRAQVRRRITLDCHTLKDLRRLNHPYARKHGTIQIHKRNPWQVHRQSGQMVSALKAGLITQGNAVGYEVTFDYSAAPHAAMVITGTKVMLPRDVLYQTAIDSVTQKEMMQRIVKVLGQKLRTKLGLRFGGGLPATTQQGTPGGSLGIA